MIWIRSQKGTSLVEVSHVKICEALSNGKITSYTIDYDTPDATFELGRYSTKEKALKVLNLIEKRILLNTLRETGVMIPNPIVFQMPQDNEVEE